jgi:SRSO17 transposase
MIAVLVQRGVVAFRWVTCDESYGKIPAFLKGIAALDKWYLAEVPADTRVWLRTPPIELPGRGPLGRPRTHPRVKRTAPRPLEMRALLTQLPRAAWQRRKIQEGSKGPMMVELACVRVTPVRESMPGPRSWAIFRRTLGSQPVTKFYLSNAPTECPKPELARITGMRWPVETALEEAKGEVGLDHYETRTWQGWHHHLLHSFLAHLFLMRLRLLFQKKARPSPRPRPVNWWHAPSKTKPNACPTSPTSCVIANAAIMLLIVRTANGHAPSWTNHQNAVDPKSRSNNRNLVVI